MGTNFDNGITWDDPRIGKPIAPIAASAWIDPLGKFYAVPDCGHSRWAEEQMNTWGLESLGWVHVSFGTLIYNSGKVRQCQIDTLFDYIMACEEADYGYTDKLRESYQYMLETECQS